MSGHEAEGAPSWAWFAGKMVLALGWLGAAAWAALQLLRGGAGAHVLTAALFVALAPAAWVLAKAVALKRMDEAQAHATWRGLIQGLLFACVLPGATIGGGVLSALIFGAGAVNVDGMMQSAVIWIAILPPIAFFMSELAAFAIRVTFAGQGEQ